MKRNPWKFENPLCREIGTDLFFPKRTGGTADVTMARMVCGLCEHTVECLDYALQYRFHGVWGGTSVSERIAIQRKRKIVPRPITLERD
jgi:hypothetical protein